jgi:hypothetical protein
MGDLKSRRWILAKGAMFCLIALATVGLLLLDSPSLRTAALLAVLVWSSCRLYYFLFYVLEKYVDPSFRYAGLLALASGLWRRRNAALRG